MPIVNVRFLFTCFFLSFNIWSWAQPITVNLFNGTGLQSFNFSPQTGIYDVVADNETITQIATGDMLQIAVSGGGVTAKTSTEQWGVYNTILVRKAVADSRRKRKNTLYGEPTSFRLTPVVPSSWARLYDDSLTVQNLNGSLFLLYRIALEKYVAGVVEAESGPWSTRELYKMHALVCRTYALRNVKRHRNDGFLMCDGQHCQVFLGKVRLNNEIVTATNETAGFVVVDSSNQLIDAVFSANCGGQTMTSKDVWGWDASYLQSVQDPYCTSQPQAQWNTTIAVKDWVEYLTRKSLADSNRHWLDFDQTERKLDYVAQQQFSVPLRQVRDDWKWRSSFFSMKVQGDSIVVSGRGYGHGIGMCQEGAMEMARRGFSYDDIIRFYYQGVRVVPMRKLHITGLR